MPAVIRTVCPLCDGDGCAECDHTGEQVTTFIDAEDGMSLRVRGSAPLTPETEEALREIASAAMKKMEESND